VSSAKTVIGFDPGKHNFGVAVVQFTPATRPKITLTRMLDEAIKSLLHGDFDQACQAFARAVRRLFRRFRPWRIIIERFLTRFRGFGNTGELVGVMIGIIWSVARKFNIQVILTTAASWKNQFSRDTALQLRNIYQQCKPLPPHCLDAALLAVYGYSKVASYQRLNLHKFFHREIKRWLALKQKK
jgi:Holliday junction resolvasome RuvABC endonuclease subunit